MDPATELAEGRRECAMNMALHHAGSDYAIEAVIDNAAKIEAFLKGSDTAVEPE